MYLYITLPNVYGMCPILHVYVLMKSAVLCKQSVSFSVKNTPLNLMLTLLLSQGTSGPYG